MHGLNRKNLIDIIYFVLEDKTTTDLKALNIGINLYDLNKKSFDECYNVLKDIYFKLTDNTIIKIEMLPTIGYSINEQGQIQNYFNFVDSKTNINKIKTGNNISILEKFDSVVILYLDKNNTLGNELLKHKFNLVKINNKQR